MANSAAQIRARVEEAARLEIERRATAAERVAAAYSQRSDAETRFAAADAEYSAAVADALTVLSASELRTFTDLPTAAFSDRGRKRSSTRGPARRKSSESKAATGSKSVVSADEEAAPEGAESS